MSLIKTESEREVQTLARIQKRIERTEKIHKLVILGLTSILVAALSLHAFHGCRHCHK